MRGPRCCSERCAGTVEQRANRRTDQQIEDPQASDVWPRRCRIASRSDVAVAGSQLAPRVNQTRIRCRATNLAGSTRNNPDGTVSVSLAAAPASLTYPCRCRYHCPATPQRIRPAAVRFPTGFLVGSLQSLRCKFTGPLPQNITSQWSFSAPGELIP